MKYISIPDASLDKRVSHILCNHFAHAIRLRIFGAPELMKVFTEFETDFRPIYASNFFEYIPKNISNIELKHLDNIYGKCSMISGIENDTLIIYASNQFTIDIVMK